MTDCNILSIGAWRYGGDCTWNQWFILGTCSDDVLSLSTRKLLSYLRRGGFLGPGSIGRVSVDDDGYNVVIRARGTLEPLLAIEYGALQR